MTKVLRFLPEIQRTALGAAFSRRKGTIAVFLAVTLLSAACTVAGPLIFAHGVKVIGEGLFTPGSLLAIFGAFALVMAATRFLGDVRVVLMNAVEQDVRLETNKNSLAALMRAGGSIFVANNPAKVSELVNELHMSNTIYVQMFLMVVLAGAVELLLSFFAIGGFVSWWVAVFVVVYGAASVWLTLRSNKATTPYQRRARGKSNQGANLLGNVVANIVSIKIFRSQGWVQGLYEGFANGARGDWLTYYRVRLRFGAVQAALIAVQYASIFAMLIVTLKSPDLLNQIVLVSMILVQLNRPFEMIAAAIQEFAEAQVLAGMLQEELDAHPQPSHAGGAQRIGEGARMAVALSRVSFAYSPEDKPLLDGVTTTFTPHGLNFIVGPSGSGKSSLLQILLGINGAYEGTVRVGDIDLRNVDMDSYLATLGYVAQEPMLMNLSIRENVLFGRQFSDVEVLAALRTVRLGDKVASLAEGLDYRIGERGQLLSGGERQRLAIARALIARPKILILDEASSALDETTESGIFASLRETAEETTVIAVTHRVGVIAAGDRVLDLSAQEGRQAEPMRA